jgi:hypothetical protein
LSEESRKPSEVRQDFEVYNAISEINFKVADVKLKIEELKRLYAD